MILILNDKMIVEEIKYNKDKKTSKKTINRITKFYAVKCLKNINSYGFMDKSYQHYYCFKTDENLIYVHGDSWGVILTIDQARKYLKYKNEKPKNYILETSLSILFKSNTLSNVTFYDPDIK